MTTRAASKSKVELEKEKLRAEIRKHTADARLSELRYERAQEELKDEDATDAAHHVYTFDSAVSGTTVKACSKALAYWSRRDPKCDITIVFDSPGGSVIDGLRLYDHIQEIKRQGHKVTTVCLGMAASMGGILLQAGDHRVVGKHAWFLIHEVSSGAFGKTSEMEDELRFVRRLQNQLVGILSERSTMTPNQIKTKWKKKDWWLDSNETVSLGFADEIAA